MEVVGESAPGPETIACANEMQPDVLILDIFPNDPEALDLIASLRMATPAAKIIVLNATSSGDYLRQFLSAGVCGYLPSSEANQELVKAVKTVAQDQVFLCAEATTALLRKYREQVRARSRGL